METLKQRAGKIIRAKRIAAGYKRQGNLAEALGCDQSRVSQWESGKEMPDTAYRLKMHELIKTIDADFEPAVIRDNGEPNFEAAIERAAERVLSKRASTTLPDELIRALENATPAMMKTIRALLKLDPVTDFSLGVPEEPRSKKRS